MKKVIILCILSSTMLLTIASCKDWFFEYDDKNVEFYGPKTIAIEETAVPLELEEATTAETIAETTEFEENSPEDIVYIAPTGKKYHLSQKCAGKNATEVLLEDIKDEREPCKKCVK